MDKIRYISEKKVVVPAVLGLNGLKSNSYMPICNLRDSFKAEIAYFYRNTEKRNPLVSAIRT